MSETPPVTRRPPRRRIALIMVPIAVGAVAAVTIGIVAANVARVGEPTQEQFPVVEMEIDALPPGLKLVNPEDLEHAGGVMDLAVMAWQTRLQNALYGDSNLGSLAISPDGQVLTITWYGSTNDTLQQLLAEAPEGLEVVILPADFAPGELQELVMRAIQPEFVPGVQIAMGGAEQDGSGLHFGLVERPKGKTLTQVADEIGRALNRTDVPIRVDVSGALMPISG